MEKVLCHCNNRIESRVTLLWRPKKAPKTLAETETRNLFSVERRNNPQRHSMLVETDNPQNGSPPHTARRVESSTSGFGMLEFLVQHIISWQSKSTDVDGG
jgi:hypothetical protein